MIIHNSCGVAALIEQNGCFSVYPHYFTGSFLFSLPFLPSIKNAIDAMKFSIALLDFWMNGSVIELAAPTTFLSSVDHWSPPPDSVQDDPLGCKKEVLELH